MNITAPLSPYNSFHRTNRNYGSPQLAPFQSDMVPHPGILFFSIHCTAALSRHNSLGLALARGVRVCSLEPPSLKLLPHKLDIFSILLVKLPPSQVLHAFQTSSFFFNGSPFTVVRHVRCATVTPFEPPSLKLFSQHVHIFYFHLVKLPSSQVLHACLAISTILHC